MMQFTKMEGLGNDYIYLNCLEGMPPNLPELAQRMSHRHFGVGADGMICICPSTVGDYRMAMYNADGSQGEMCGNGIRCVGKYLYDKGLTTKTILQIETLAGVRTLWLHVGEDGKVEEVTVHMGRGEIFPAITLQLAGQAVEGIPVSVGNPHFVLLWENIGEAPVEKLGKQIECHPNFPNRTNVEFVHMVSRSCGEMRVWERGSGETLACGTGACASFVALRSLGLCGKELEMKLLGGRLHLSADGDGILMRGTATTVYEGTW